MGERVLSLPGASYSLEPGWGRLPQGMAFGHVVGLAVDGEDNVYVLNRGERRVVVFSREGDYLDAWGGEDLFLNPHCVCFDSRGDLYVGETLEGSRVQKFTRL